MARKFFDNISNYGISFSNRCCNLKRESRGGVVRAGKGITLVILNEDMDDITIVKSLQYSSGLIDGVCKTVKHEIKKKGKCIP